MTDGRVGGAVVALIKYLFVNYEEVVPLSDRSYFKSVIGSRTSRIILRTTQGLENDSRRCVGDTAGYGRGSGADSRSKKPW